VNRLDKFLPHCYDIYNRQGIQLPDATFFTRALALKTFEC